MLIKGLRKHEDLLTTILTLLYCLKWLFLFGHLNGFYTYTDTLNTNEYDWDTASIINIILFWSTWLSSMIIIVHSKECTEFKVGGIIGYSLPAFVSFNVLYHAIYISGFVPNCVTGLCSGNVPQSWITEMMWGILNHW